MGNRFINWDFIFDNHKKYMSEPEFTPVAPKVESFRGYITELDIQLEAYGGIAIPFIAFARMSGADVDKVFVKEDFENFMELAANEYDSTITKHNEIPGSFKVK